MLGKLFKNEKAKVYLGEMVVAPAGALKGDDGWGLLESEDLAAGLRNSLKELVDLPPIQELSQPEDSDLVLDIAVVKHQGGSLTGISVGGVYKVPLLWKPKVVLKARLYRRVTGKTVNVFSSTKKVTWRQYSDRALKLTSLFALKPMFGVKDMEILLCQACIEVLEKVQKKL